MVAALLLLSNSPQWPTTANACALQQVPCLEAIERSVVALFEKTAPSVVQVTALSGLNDKARFAISLGSGFIWDLNGNIVTNEHVVRGAELITISLASGKQFDADVVGLAPNYDLAVLRLKQAQEFPGSDPTRQLG